MYLNANRPADAVAEQLGLARNTVFVVKHRITRRLGELQRALDDCEID